jgi:hypothetical protein
LPPRRPDGGAGTLALRDGGRLLDARIVCAQHIAIVAGDLDALIAAGAKAALAFQRTDAAGLRFHGVQRIDARDLHVQLRSGAGVERGERLAGGRIPFAIDIAGLATDALELGLQQARERLDGDGWVVRLSTGATAATLVSSAFLPTSAALACSAASFASSAAFFSAALRASSSALA